MVLEWSGQGYLNGIVMEWQRLLKWYWNGVAKAIGMVLEWSGKDYWNGIGMEWQRLLEWYWNGVAKAIGMEWLAKAIGRSGKGYWNVNRVI